jgi:hypothetical protein
MALELTLRHKIDWYNVLQGALVIGCLQPLPVTPARVSAVIALVSERAKESQVEVSEMLDQHFSERLLGLFASFALFMVSYGIIAIGAHQRWSGASLVGVALIPLLGFTGLILLDRVWSKQLKAAPCNVKSK